MSQIEVGDLLYRVSVKFTRVAEYGVSIEALMGGQAPPPQGARFDVAFEGTSKGDKLNGAAPASITSTFAPTAGLNLISTLS
jgi:hypothetical protein